MNIRNRVLVSQSYLTLCDPMDCSRQAPLSKGFSKQGYWSGLPFPSPGDFPAQGLNPSLHCRQILYRLSHQGHTGKDVRKVLWLFVQFE